MSNFTEVIGLTLAWRNIRRPKAALGVAPGMMRQKRDFRWPVSMSRQVIEAEILQGVWPDGLLTRLERFAYARRDELG